MELKNKPDQVIKLGKRIVEELEIQQSSDILTKWLSHYLAELFSELEVCTKDDRKSKEKECVELILKIWEKKEVMRIDPMKDLSSAISILEVICSNNETFQGYRPRPQIRSDVFAEFAQVVDSSVNDIMVISFAFSLLDTKFAKIKKWKSEFPDTLSEEDDLLISTLDLLLGRTGMIIFTKEKDQKSISELSPKKRNKVLIKKLEELIENQSTALEHLKEQL